MSNATYCLSCSGNTRQWKESLKARNWKYDPSSQTWYLRLVKAHADRIRSKDEAFLKGLGGNLKGCRLCLEGIEVWRSKTYVAANAQPARNATRQPDPDGFGWNCDAHGNPVSSRVIPGSAPDDMI